jgi:hypothetical protein
MASAMAGEQVQVEEKQGFVDDSRSKKKCKQCALISAGVLLAIAVQSALTVGMVSVIIAPHLPHVGPYGNLESETGNTVATTPFLEIADVSELGSMPPEKLKMLHTLEMSGPDEQWSSFHIASVHKLGADKFTLLAVDGTTINIESGTVSVVHPPGSNLPEGRRLNVWGAVCAYFR